MFKECRRATALKIFFKLKLFFFVETSVCNVVIRRQRLDEVKKKLWFRSFLARLFFDISQPKAMRIYDTFCVCECAVSIFIFCDIISEWIQYFCCCFQFNIQILKRMNALNWDHQIALLEFTAILWLSVSITMRLNE